MVDTHVSGQCTTTYFQLIDLTEYTKFNEMRHNEIGFMKCM